MCGIVGYVGNNYNAINVIIDGLTNLEYRGYDSAGIAYSEEGLIKIIKEKGKLENLKKKLDMNILSNLGIGHTRWATHGEANLVNSHPHKVGKVTIVHNGIIENYSEIKEELREAGYNFISDTDSEVGAALLDKIYNETKSVEQTLSLFLKKTRGAYALGIIIDGDNHLYALKKDSPLIIGVGNSENFISSDVPAILKYTNKYIVLEDSDFAKISADKIIVYDNKVDIKKYEVREFKGKSIDISKNGYDHFMLKEIYEQPEVIKNTFSSFVKDNKLDLNIPNLNKYRRIDIVACGSAYHAGYVGKMFIEEYGNIEVNVEVASEYRYKKLFLDSSVLVIVISQSGETADTLAALKLAKKSGCFTIGIINVVESSIARLCDKVLYTKAGPEIAVATTKGYTSQVAILALIAIQLSNKNIDGLRKLPIIMQSILDDTIEYKEIANKIFDKDPVFFIGRDIDYALCMEGSLKLKEISYINSAAYKAGELKHGTISLIEKGTIVIAIMTEPKIMEKTISNIKETKARGAYVILITTLDVNPEQDYFDEVIYVPRTEKLFQPMLTVLPLQLLAYEVAKLKGCDIDKPKNLAKSVTVE
ncbi:MAG: glutamine--fructose-6-phosphate transaminase (isomerizing) [Bacilli bacterium]